MKKKNKVYNPLLGKYLSSGENLVCALFIKQSDELITKWKDSGSPLSFDTWLFELDYDTPIKGVVNKFISKRLRSVVETLIAIWKNSDFEKFDTFLEYHHKRALSVTPVNSK